MSIRGEVGIESPVTTGVAAAGGAQLYFEMRGEGDAVVLLHGYTLDSRVWDSQFAALSKSHRVVRFDMRGHGRSSGARAEEGAPTQFSQSDDVLGLLDFLEIDKAHLVGLSMGGYVSYEFALEHPQRVRSLSLLDSAWRWDPSNTGDFQKRLVGYVTASSLEAGLRGWLADALFMVAARSADVKQRLDEIVLGGHLALGPQSHFANPMSTASPNPLAETRLTDLETPTLVIVGELEEPEFRAHSERLASAIGRAEKIVIRGSGHMCTMEKPDEVNHALAAFLAKH